jgi:uncharacterized tellurite resistance protein B-like protein
MRITVLDGSNYFRGLLLLVRKDRKIDKSEAQMIKRIGKTLGFEREFCENAVHEIMENTHILDAPPEFSSKDVAMKFIRDGFAVALSDADIHPAEEEWLRSTAEKNGLEEDWFQRESLKAREKTDSPLRLEVDDLTVAYS